MVRLRAVCGPYEEQRARRKHASSSCRSSSCGRPDERDARRRRGARRSARTSTRRSSSRPRPAPARRPSWSRGSSRCCAPARPTLERIVAVTFTEKAAGEMKLRLRTGAREGARPAPRRARSRSDASTPRSRSSRSRASGRSTRSAPTSCASGPSRRSVDPLFEVDARGGRRAPLRRAPSTLVPGGARRSARGRAAHAPAKAARARSGRPRERSATRPASSSSSATSTAHGGATRSSATPRSTRRRELAGSPALAEQADRADDWLAKNLRSKVERFVAELAAAKRVRAARPRRPRGRARRARADEGVEIVGGRGQNSARRPEARRRASRSATPPRRELDALRRAADADLAACLQRRAPPARRAPTSALKAKAGKLDFSTCSSRARDLVKRRRRGARRAPARFTPPLRRRVPGHRSAPGRDPRLLAADDPTRPSGPGAAVPGKLFLVGDPKQAIYRFRRADVALYEQVKTRLLAQRRVASCT